jgi:hypothetical protein
LLVVQVPSCACICLSCESTYRPWALALLSLWLWLLRLLRLLRLLLLLRLLRLLRLLISTCLLLLLL